MTEQTSTLIIAAIQRGEVVIVVDLPTAMKVKGHAPQRVKLVPIRLRATDAYPHRIDCLRLEGDFRNVRISANVGALRARFNDWTLADALDVQA